MIFRYVNSFQPANQETRIKKLKPILYIRPQMFAAARSESSPYLGIERVSSHGEVRRAVPSEPRLARGQSHPL
jgi:hypothetical protein